MVKSLFFMLQVAEDAEYSVQANFIGMLGLGPAISPGGDFLSLPGSVQVVVHLVFQFLFGFIGDDLLIRLKEFRQSRAVLGDLEGAAARGLEGAAVHPFNLAEMKGVEHDLGGVEGLGLLFFGHEYIRVVPGQGDSSQRG